MPSRPAHLLIAGAVFGAELLIATTFSQVELVRSFLGDYLVVILLYHLAQAIRPVAPLRLAIGVFAFSCAVEVSQLFHLADALGFRPGGLLYILAGNTFSWVDLLMYALGCATAGLVDRLFLRVGASARASGRGEAS